MRKYLLETTLPHKSEWASSYYANSIPDRFMNELFVNEFPQKLRKKIPLTTINITDEEALMNHSQDEKIKRKFFTLLEKELGKNYPITSDEKKIKYFSVNRFKRSIGKLKNGLVNVWWLRGVDLHHRYEYVAVVADNGYVDYANVIDSMHIRPSFCLPPDTEIVKKKVKGEEIYVLKDFQDLPKADILVENIDLTGHALQKYYVKHRYLRLEVAVKPSQAQYGAILSDNLTIQTGKNAVIRAVTFSNGKFDGWYLDDKLIATEKTLTYQVTKNQTIQAKFSKK
jgi:hypothetical protein